MPEITITPQDLNGQLILRFSLATGEYGGEAYTVDQAVNGDLIINFRGQQVGVSMSEIVKQVLRIIEETK